MDDPVQGTFKGSAAAARFCRDLGEWLLDLALNHRVEIAKSDVDWRKEFTEWLWRKHKGTEVYSKLFNRVSEQHDKWKGVSSQ